MRFVRDLCQHSFFELLFFISVRSTNVYEEQSLGVFHESDIDDDLEEGFETSGPRMSVWSRYLAMHARRQLAFGKFSFCFMSWMTSYT